MNEKLFDKKYDLVVAYRVYPKLSKGAIDIFNNKFELVEMCLRSFKKSLGNLKVRMFVLLDDCPTEYTDLFKKYFDINDLDIMDMDGIGNLRTFQTQVGMLCSQGVSQFVYFAEDDYYYFPNQIEKMISFLKENKDVDFVTPYDHLDYYTHILHKHKTKIKVFGNKHWRQVNSTCLTFLTTRKVLQKTKKVFFTYTRNKVEDVGLWLALTKKHLFNPIAILKFLIYKPIVDKYILKTWFYNLKQILFGKRYKLWSPIPTIATHMTKDFLSPCIDWNTIFWEDGR